jgi:hypothetical protein
LEDDLPKDAKDLTREQMKELAEIFLILEKWQHELDLQQGRAASKLSIKMAHVKDSSL